MVASAPSSSESAEDACLTKMSLFRGHNADGTRGDHSALVRRARATRGQVPHHPRGVAQWSGYSATSRVDILQTSSLTSRLGEASTGAGLSRHDDIERTLLMLPNSQSLLLCIDLVSASCRITVVPPRASAVIAVTIFVYTAVRGPPIWPMARASTGTDETMVSLRLACGHIYPRYWYVSDDAA